MTESGDNSALGKHSQVLATRVALAATRPAQSACDLTTDELIGLREGTLSSTERQRVLAVLDSSEACYEEWLTLNRYLDEEEAAGSKRRGRKYVPWAIGTVAASALVGLILFMTRPPDLEALLDQSYAQALSSGTVSISTSPLEFMEDPGSGLGFTGSGGPLQRALGAGLWAGAALLRGEADASYPAALLPPGTAAADLTQRPWQGTDWAAHATLGRWTVLAVAGCQQPSPAPTEFWQEQAGIATRLRGSVAAESSVAATQVLLTQLDALTEPFEKLVGGGNPARPCNAVVTRAGRMAALADRHALPGSRTR